MSGQVVSPSQDAEMAITTRLDATHLNTSKASTSFSRTCSSRSAICRVIQPEKGMLTYGTLPSLPSDPLSSAWATSPLSSF